MCNVRTEGQINGWRVEDETEGWRDGRIMQRRVEGGEMREGQASYLQIISIHVTNKLKQRNKKKKTKQNKTKQKQQKQKKLPQISHTRKKIMIY